MRIPTTFGRRAVLLGTVLGVAAATVIGTAAPAFAATTALTVSTTRGPSGGGNIIAATVGADTFTLGDPTSAYVQFQYRAGLVVACAATFQAAAPISVTAGVHDGGVINVPTTGVTVPSITSLTITVPSTLVLAGTPQQVTANYNICVYASNSVASSLLIADTDALATGYTINGHKLNLNTYQGPSGGGNTVAATTTGGSFSGGISVEFQYVGALALGYCTATYKGAVPPAASSPTTQTAGIVLAPASAVLTSTKAAITVPVLLALTTTPEQLSANYNVCIYDGTTVDTSALIAGTATPYLIAKATTVSAVTPSAGPAQGGSTITVTGTNFPATGMTATLAGQALTILAIASNGLSFTATVPAHTAGGPYNLVVTTQAGATTRPAVFTYTNGIVVTPSTAPGTGLARTWIDVKGIGFAELAFTNTSGSNSNAAGAHAYLVRGTYDPKPTTTGGSTKTTGQVLECVDVLVIDDTEVVCGLFLAGNQASTGSSRTVSSCTTSSTALSTLTAATTSTTCTFTAADVGMTVAGTSIAAGTTITAVTGPTTATLSKPSTIAVLATTSITLSPSRTITDAVIASGTLNQVSSATLAFSSSEVGHAISGPGIPTGTTITGVSAGVATLSNPATAAQASVTMVVWIPFPVSDGTYTVTIVNNGLPNAQATAGYTQSIITSGSTFTVADYL